MEIAFFAILLFCLIGGFVFLFKNLSRKTKPDDQGLLLLQNQINELTRAIDTKLSESNRAMLEQSGRSEGLVKNVTEKLTQVSEGQKQVVTLADQLKNLQDILKNPKQRGILGEYQLETLLKNVFPPGVYQMQYPFSNGDIVDAVIFIKDKIIPIDSKFSLENYNRIVEEHDPAERERLEKAFKQDLKNRIDETAKYVRPEENTMDFAFMFIPAEGIYYDLLVNQVGTLKSNTRDLIEYAFIEKRVHIVSPTTLLSHLKMVLQGLKALQFEESAKEIRIQVENLGRHLRNYETYFEKVGSHLTTTKNAYDSAAKELGKIDKDVMKIAGAETETESRPLDKPKDLFG